MQLCTCFFLHALIWARGHIAGARDVAEHCLQEACIDTKSPVLMQFARKRNTPSPVMDADADFIEDANNPLEKMYALEDALGDSMTARNMALVQDPPKFECKEGVSKWKLGWSEMKKDFCCQTAKIGCAEGTETESNGTKNNKTNSGNETGSINITNNTSNMTSLSTCITRKDPRVSSTFYTTSPAGTPCVFGVDPRDEGSHCIMEAGKYGSFGWCYTSKSRQSWGSCSESCPLFGPSKVLGAKINKIDSELGDRVRAELKKVLAGPTQENTTTVPTHGQTTAAPAASGNKSGNATGNASGKADDANDDDTGNAKKKTSGNAVGKGKKAANGTGSLKRTKHDGHDTQE